MRYKDLFKNKTSDIFLSDELKRIVQVAIVYHHMERRRLNIWSIFIEKFNKAYDQDVSSVRIDRVEAGKDFSYTIDENYVVIGYSYHLMDSIRWKYSNYAAYNYWIDEFVEQNKERIEKVRSL